jgi:hypothetical protein
VFPGFGKSSLITFINLHYLQLGVLLLPQETFGLFPISRLIFLLAPFELNDSPPHLTHSTTNFTAAGRNCTMTVSEL